MKSRAFFLSRLVFFSSLVSTGLTACHIGNQQPSLIPQTNIIAQNALFANTAQQQDFKDVAYGNGIYLAVGSNGAIYTSNNMRHWFEQAGVTTKNINGVVFNSVRKQFYAIGDSGLFMSSADGVAWTIYQALSPGVRLNAINVTNDGNEVIGGDAGNIFEIIISKDGSTSDKVVNRKFYSSSGIDQTSSVNTIAIGNVYMVAGNSAGLSNTKANNLFESADWEYGGGKINGTDFADIVYYHAADYFIGLLRNGTVGNLGAKKQTNKWSIAVCIAHKHDGECLVDAVANSITEDQASEDLLTVGGGTDDAHTFVAISEDTNSWIKTDIPELSKLNKIRCFGDRSDSECLAVGDNKAVVSVKVMNDKVMWSKVNLTSPAVTSVKPKDGATQVVLTPIMELGFNLPVKNVTSSNVAVYEDHIGGTKIPLGSFTPNLTNDNFTFTPTKPLSAFTKYVMVVESGIVDKYSMRIKPQSYSFTTGNSAKLEMSVVSPEIDARGISLNPSIDIKFSHPVNNLNSNIITLHEGSTTGNTVSTSSLTQHADNNYAIDVINQLKPLTKYCIVVAGNLGEHNELEPTYSCFYTGNYLSPKGSVIGSIDAAKKMDVQTDVTASNR